MREDLLQFIWRYSYFNSSSLLTEAGEDLRVLSPGMLNTGAGPDFQDARVLIGGVLHEGPVELHIKASDWNRHGHSADGNYRGVILHVVWEDDGGPANLPVLVLQHRVSKLLLGQYEGWMRSQLFVPCAEQLHRVQEAVWTVWKDRLLRQRLRQRLLLVRRLLEQNRQHWEETTWWMMARSLGLPANGAAFEAVARSVPVRLMVRHRLQPMRLKAMLVEQAGLLGGAIRRTGMRPAHRPEKRLAQLVQLYSTGEGWFARIKETVDAEELLDSLCAEGLGAEARRSILINAFVPVLFAYGWLRGEPALREKAFRWLNEVTAEKNSIIIKWQRLGVGVMNAADSQSLLELKKHYCDDRRCLDCAIGRSLLGR
ncbi:MAG: DUF2851 family protein [Bacteroidetes bacterium]|nr:DUF2851 family protein [Bacteroidota bacterium]